MQSTNVITSLTGRTTTELCRRAGFSPRIIAETNEFSIAQGYVAAGLAVGLAPMLALGVVRRHVVVRRLKRSPEPRHVWIMTRGAPKQNPVVTEFSNALAAARRSLRGR